MLYISFLGDTIQSIVGSDTPLYRLVKEVLSVGSKFKSRFEAKNIVEWPWPEEVTELMTVCAAALMGGRPW